MVATEVNCGETLGWLNSPRSFKTNAKAFQIFNNRSGYYVLTRGIVCENCDRLPIKSVIQFLCHLSSIFPVNATLAMDRTDF